MNKKEAAAFLNVSERAIERYTSKGKLHVHYQKRDIGGSVAIYDEAELKALRDAIHNKPQVQKIEKTQDNTATPRKQTALERGGVAEFAQMFMAAHKAQRDSERFSVPITEKLTLDLSEAAALSGLSRSFLMVAIKEQKLQARKVGRGWRVKRVDLDKYVQNF